MQWLWTWGGICFGYREGDDLWTHDGQHVGRFRDNEVYGRDGRYLGELVNGDRLITNKAKSSSRQSGFSPSGRRNSYARNASYAGYAVPVTRTFRVWRTSGETRHGFDSNAPNAVESEWSHQATSIGRTVRY